jgi:hypothetical protein
MRKVLLATAPNIHPVSTERATTGKNNNFLAGEDGILSCCAVACSTGTSRAIAQTIEKDFKPDLVFGAAR